MNQQKKSTSKNQQQPDDLLAADTFQTAMQHHQQGDFVQAEMLYRQILQHEPHNSDALHYLGLLAYQTGKNQQAIELMTQAISIEPSSSAVYCNLGLALQAQAQLDAALENYQKAIFLNPDYAEAHNNLGNLYVMQNKFSAAIESYHQVLSLNPNNAAVHNNLGSLLKAQGKLEMAVENFQQAILINPSYAEAYYNLGIAFHGQGHFTEAADSFQQAILFKPDYAEAYSNYAVTLRDQEKLEAAIENWQKAIALKPGYADAYHNLGIVFHRQGKLEAATESYQHAILLKPDYAEAHYNLAAALKDQGKLEAAIENCQRAIFLKPDYVDAYNNLGIIFQAQGKLDAAVDTFQQALSIHPTAVNVYNNLGSALCEQKKFDAAIESYQQALSLNPNAAIVHNNLGIALKAQGKLDLAIESYERALLIDPDFSDAQGNLGAVFHAQGKFEAAMQSFKITLSLEPNHTRAFCDLFYAQLQCCEWSAYSNSSEKVIAGVKSGELDFNPLGFLAISDSIAAQQQCNDRFSQNYPPAETALWAGQRYSHHKIRVAYVSADFREHPVSYLMVGLFEQHDPKRFEIIAISLQPEHNSATGQRVKAAFSQFIDVSRQSDYEVAVLMRELEIDIAVDLMGFTGMGRTEIFAYRPAPIQINYLGFAGSIRAKFMNYILADKHIIPCEQQIYYTEKVVYLPDSYLVNDAKRVIAERIFTRAEVNLPETGFVFCCFNNNYKITPDIFALWMRLLKKIKNSVLWLAESNSFAADNLRKEAVLRGISPERLIFAPKFKNIEDHLARHRLADLFLDTLPYNAHSTASDALWAGLPVLTCMGNAFASRVAGSLLHAIGLPELITHNLEEYEALAFKLATTPAILNEIRAKLAKNRATYPLFNTDRFTRHIEAAYITMWEKCQRGELPASFTVPAQAIKQSA